MASKKPWYAPKSHGGRPHELIALVFDFIEDSIHVVVAALLLVAGLFVLWSAASTFAGRVQRGAGRRYYRCPGMPEG